MRNLTAIALLLGFASVSTSASACFMYFDLKGAQNGVEYGDCSCDGRYIGTGTRQQCYDATIGAAKQAKYEQAKAAAQKAVQEMIAKDKAKAEAEAAAAAKSPQPARK